MRSIEKGFALGLLALVLMTGCYRVECEITCADGFKITTADECEDWVMIDLASDHGGSCSGDEEKFYYWW
jgi:hypothetical protein